MIMPFISEILYYKSYIEIGFYILLLFFAIPVRIEKEFQRNGEFLQYMETFNKSYSDEETFKKHLKAFQISIEKINHLNANRIFNSARYGLTKFSDLTPEEFLKFQNNIPKNNKLRLLFPEDGKNNKNAKIYNETFLINNNNNNNLPQIVDWREKNILTKIKDQKMCGACWAFSIIETIESMKAIKSKKLAELSVQQMIDCSIYNNGCFGGDTCSLLNWLKNFNISIFLETAYPLIYHNDQCKNRKENDDGVKLQNFVCQSLVGREEIILKLLAVNGPVTVGVNGETWQNYVGGILEFHHCDGNLNHAVQIVGYNLTSKIPYYIVRNSWGEDFGDNGYLYLAIGDNVCGIATEVAALTVE